MRMPRSSSFSVRDILDLPQMKSSVSSSATPVSGGGDDDNPTENGAANDGSTEIVLPQNSFSVANEALTPLSYNAAADSNNSRLQQSKLFQLIEKEIDIW